MQIVLVNNGWTFPDRPRKEERKFSWDLVESFTEENPETLLVGVRSDVGGTRGAICSHPHTGRDQAGGDVTGLGLEPQPAVRVTTLAASSPTWDSQFGADMCLLSRSVS